MNSIEASLVATDLKVAIVATRWNDLVVSRLVEGARSAFVRHGGSEDNLDLMMVPGAVELPLAAKRLAESGRYAAIACLGAVIRGATDHHEYVAGNAASGLSRVALETGVPVGFGVLTTDTLEQAMERAGSKAGNKGEEAVMAAVEMANLLSQL